MPQKKHRGRPFTGSGYVVSSPLQVWKLRVDNSMVMIDLYLPQPHEEVSESEFEGNRGHQSHLHHIIEVGSV